LLLFKTFHTLLKRFHTEHLLSIFSLSLFLSLTLSLSLSLYLCLCLLVQLQCQKYLLFIKVHYAFLDEMLVPVYKINLYVYFICIIFQQISYLYYGDGTEPIITLSLTGLVACVFCLGLAIGVVLAVGMLLYFQVIYILMVLACSFSACSRTKK
jgi:hypothetical protein